MPQPKQGISPDAFVAQYGDVRVTMGNYPRPIPLSTAARMISMCGAKPEAMADPDRVLRHLAGKVGADLLPEHQHLLEPRPGES